MTVNYIGKKTVIRDSFKEYAEKRLKKLGKFFDDDHIEYIKAPGTLEGGDVMMVGDHFYVGRSARTNEEGIRQLTEILAKYGLTCSEVTLEKVLHRA